MSTRAKIQSHLLRFGEMPDAQKVAWLGQALVLLLEAELTRQNSRSDVKQALRDYYLALDQRKNANTAMSVALDRIQEVLGMSWQQGAETKRRTG